MKKNIYVNKGIILTLIISFVIIVIIKYVDAEIASGVMNIIRSVHKLNQVTENIPDLLPHFVGIGSVLMWVIYLYRTRKKKFDKETLFLRLAATVLPVSYLIKSISKFIFGRTGPRDWLLHKQPLTFHWLKIWSSSFPSGHMLVFVAFGTAVLFYYPKYRRLVIILLTLLGVALVATDYHFLSDVIAGSYLGIITTYSIQYFYENQSIHNEVKTK